MNRFKLYLEVKYLTSARDAGEYMSFSDKHGVSIQFILVVSTLFGSKKGHFWNVMVRYLWTKNLQLTAAFHDIPVF